MGYQVAVCGPASCSAADAAAAHEVGRLLADAVIVIGGSWGTLSELRLARRRGLPVVSLRGWRVVDHAGAPVDDGIVRVDDAAAAVRAALAELG
jgi:hypothetical protein